MVHRYYDPATGQFLSGDSLVDQTEQPYFYAGDDPVDSYDPNGLCLGIPYSGPCPGSHLLTSALHRGRQVAAGVGNGLLQLAASDYITAPGQAPPSAAHIANPYPCSGDGYYTTGNVLSSVILAVLDPEFSLATAADEAVFWSGVRGGDAAAARWTAAQGGATLESTLAERGITLPAFDSSNPASVAAWRAASSKFAEGASGAETVLQEDAVRVNSVWAEVEYPALTANPNVTSITAVDPTTGTAQVIWKR